MLMRVSSGFRVLVIGMAGCLIGCGGGSTVPKLAKVTGTVQVKGEPTAGVTVIFTPTAQTKSTGASGVSGPDGKYELMHRSGEVGVEPGQYDVTFSRLVMPDGKPIPAGTSPTDVGGVESIPGNISNTATVPPEGGTFDFGIGAAAGGQPR